MYITHIHAHTHAHTGMHTYNIHSNSSALKDYRDYTGITRSKSLNLRHPLCMCILCSFESERGRNWVCIHVCMSESKHVCAYVCAHPLFFPWDLQVNVPSGCSARAAHSAGWDKNSRGGGTLSMKTTTTSPLNELLMSHTRVLTSCSNASNQISKVLPFPADLFFLSLQKHIVSEQVC